ncbi:MAG: hypothetical protein AB1418_06410 [Pseudomonadota bacterium]
MSQGAGLSFEQAPPFSVPLRFLLTAPLFLAVAGGLIALDSESLASRWAAPTLAVTHALTLGFLAMVMFGALMQMLPVVAGATLPAPRALATVGHLGLTLGTLALLAGFLFAAPLAWAAALGLLAVALGAFLTASAAALLRAVASDTVNGIRLAWVGLAATAGLGLALAASRAGWMTLPDVAATIDAHVLFGLLGWVLLLVIVVAYQVVPMFQLTPPYPPRLTRWLAFALSGLLALRAMAPGLPEAVVMLAESGLAAGVLVFALATLRLQARRRRRLADVTLDYWRVAMASLIAAVLVWGASHAWPAWADHDAYPLVLGVLFLGGFAVSVVNGMLYKIVPFLAWFHLQAQLQARAGSIPTMKDMISPRAMRGQFRLHLAACLLLVGALAWPPLVMPGGVAMAGSALWLAANLMSAVRRFAAHGGRWE